MEVGGRVDTTRQHYWERAEYWEESWRLEETCCHSNSSERQSADADVKNSKGVDNSNFIDLSGKLYPILGEEAK